MPTFLTSDKMHPALAKRVVSSVHRGRSGGAVAPPGLVAIVRFVTLVLFAGAIVFLLVARSRAKRELESARSALVDRVRAERALLRNEDVDMTRRSETWLVRLSGSYEGDLVAAELRAPGALSRLVSQPLVYVRGSVTDFQTEERIPQASLASTKDAFLLCLLEPPPARDEKTVLAQVRVAYSDGPATDRRTSNATRLQAAEVGQTLLAPAWARRVSKAETLRDVQRLSSEFKAAPLAEARRAIAARLLLAVMDEPGSSTGLSEMDGERPHDVRVGLVDLSVQEVLVRIRKRVDPAWITPSRRSSYASGLDSCALAMDVIDSVAK